MSEKTFSPLPFTVKFLDGDWDFPESLQSLLDNGTLMAVTMACDVTNLGGDLQGPFLPRAVLSNGKVLNRPQDIEQAFKDHPKISPQTVKSALFDLMNTETWSTNPAGSLWNTGDQNLWPDSQRHEIHIVVLANGMGWVFMEDMSVNTVTHDLTRDIVRDDKAARTTPAAKTRERLKNPKVSWDGLGMVILPQKRFQDCAHNTVQLPQQIENTLDTLKHIKGHNALSRHLDVLDRLITKNWMRWPNRQDIQKARETSCTKRF